MSMGDPHAASAVDATYKHRQQMSSAVYVTSFNFTIKIFKNTLTQYSNLQFKDICETCDFIL